MLAKVVSSGALLITTFCANAQISERILIDKSSVGLAENLLYAWLQTYPGEQRVDLWLMFAFTDYLRPPVRQDSVLITTQAGRQFKLSNEAVNAVRPITVYSRKAPGLQEQKTVRFENVYRFEMPPALTSIIKEDFIKSIQLEVAPLVNGLDWAKKYDITNEANLRRALTNENEKLHFGEKKLAQKDIVALMLFMEDR